MKVLVACEFSGVVREAFIAKGHDAWSCDLLETTIPGNHIKGDVLEQLDESWDMMIAHPPCTYLCVTGNKWFKPEYRDRFPDREERRTEAFGFFMSLVNAPIEKICIENPVGIMSSHWRKPDQIIQPYQFGHKEPKKTCLWLKGLPKLEPTDIVEPEYIKSKSGKRLAKWYFTPSQSDARTKMRETTFQGIAEAMADQWGDSPKQLVL